MLSLRLVLISLIQCLALCLNRFNVAGNGSYGNKGGSVAKKEFVQAKKDALKFGQAPENKVNTMSLNYDHENFLGGSLKTQAFYQDFKAIYGPYTGVYFYDPKDPKRNADQSRNNSNKIGFKVNFTRALKQYVKNWYRLRLSQ